jgi:hypothetical protein
LKIVLFEKRKFIYEAIVMASGIQRQYRYLDSDYDRQLVIDDIKQVRQNVLQTATTIPEIRHFEPRYHGWSLAAMLAHLHLMDNLALFSMQMALIGIRPPVPLPLVNRFNDFMAGVLKKRVVQTTAQEIQRNEKRVIEFVQFLPVNKFSCPVHYPPFNTYLTVERALQEYFLYHWQGHLQTIRSVEGIFYEPPGRQDVV